MDKAEEILSAKESYNFLKGAKRTLVKIAMKEHTRSQLQALKGKVEDLRGLSPHQTRMKVLELIDEISY